MKKTISMQMMGLAAAAALSAGCATTPPAMESQLTHEWVAESRAAAVNFEGNNQACVKKAQSLAGPIIRLKTRTLTNVSRIWYSNGADGYFGGAVDDMMIVVNGTSGSEEPRGLLNHSRGVLCWVTHHRGGKPTASPNSA